jgi:hypothetical protein
MKFNFRKISAVIASGLLTVSGAGFAAAANFPAPFVVGGSADVAVVYGTGAGALDQTPANNIIGNYLASKVTTGSGTPSGDSVLLAKSSDNLNLGDSWGVYTSTIDYSSLPTILEKGTYIASDNDEFKYEQTIKLGTPVLSHFKDSDYENEIGLSDKTPVVGFKLSSNTHVLNYTLDFIQDAESDITDAGKVEDIEGSDLTLFGKKYYVSELLNGTSSTYFGKMTLLDSATIAKVKEGETVTVNIAGKTYEVGISFIDSDEVKLMVNGQDVSTGKLLKGDNANIGDGSYIGVRDISKLPVSGEIGSATFSIGSGKLEITSGSAIKLNDKSITGVTGYVHKTPSSSVTEKIDKIVIKWDTNGEEFLTPASELVMPGFEGLKFTMADLVRPTEEKITVSGDSESASVIIPIKDGDASFDILYHETATGNISGIGKSTTERLATTATDVLTFYEQVSNEDQDAWFVASYATSNEAESYLLKLTVEQGTDGNLNTTTITNVVTGDEVCPDRTTSASNCAIGQVDLTISDVNWTSTDRSTTLTASAGTNFSTIYTEGGMKIYLPVSATNSTNTANGAIFINASDGEQSSEGGAGFDSSAWRLYFDGEDKDDAIAGGKEFYLTIDSYGTSGTRDLQVNDIDGTGTGGANGLEVGTSTSNYEAYIVGGTSANNATAPRLIHYTKGDPDYAEIYYPTGDSETYANVYLTSASSTLSAAGSMVFKDSEKSSWQNKNVVVVGGSCINSAAADLLGGALCESAFTGATGVGAGQYVVQSFADGFTSGKIALLVAGYHAADTAAAASRLIEPGANVDTTAGTKYIGTVGVSGSSTISKVE